jgi:hypothetical protein
MSCIKYVSLGYYNLRNASMHVTRSVKSGQTCTQSTISWYSDVTTMCNILILIIFGTQYFPTIKHSMIKGKAVLLQPWSGPEGSRKLRFPDYMTTAQDGGKVVSLMHQTFHVVIITICMNVWLTCWYTCGQANIYVDRQSFPRL